MTISILVGADGETVETVYNGHIDRGGRDWIHLDRNLPQVKKSNVSVTFYYRDDKLKFETEPTPDAEVL